jgi:phenylacetic acid degradation operon negative regulatory protein
MLTAWRRLRYLDPGLPLELLPAGWKGVAAAELFERLDTALAAPAEAHARMVISSASGS